jgi:hypothetical protein
MTLKRQLIALGACEDATDWAKDYRTLGDAWQNCQRGDWMLWLVAQTLGKEQNSSGRKRLVFAACQCARLGLPYTTDARVLAAIEVIERWTIGQASIQGVSAAAAAYAADAAAAAAYATAAAAAYAADAAAYAADAAAYAAADAAAYAADAAAYAAAVNAAAYADAARITILSQCADIVRSLFTAAELKG